MIEITRRFEAPVGLVFSFWTEAYRLAKWWAPPGFRVGEIDVDARPGGRWRIEMLGESEQRLVGVGEYSCVTTNEALAFSWSWEREAGPSPVSHVQVSFEALPGDATRITIRHTGLPTESVPAHEGGWEASLSTLEEVLDAYRISELAGPFEGQRAATWNGDPLKEGWRKAFELQARHTHTLRGDGITYHRFERTDAESRSSVWVLERATSVELVSTLRGRRGCAPYAPARGSWYTGGAAWCIKQATRLSSPYAGSRAECVRTYIESFKNEQQFSVFPKLFAPSFRHHFTYTTPDDGIRTWVATGQDFLRGFPDVQVEIVSLIEDGPFVVEHNIARGTHLGSFRGHERTGRSVQWEEIHLYRVEEGKIVENWPMVDFDHITAQLGPALT